MDRKKRGISVKENLEKVEIEVITFEENDVIATSLATISGTAEGGTEIELP